MARRPKEARLRPANLSAVQMREAIPKLRRRLAELEAAVGELRSWLLADFDDSEAAKRLIEPCIEELEIIQRRIKVTMAIIFGI